MNNRMLRGLKIVAFVIVATVVFGFVVMWLWNWLMPALFGLKTITFVQALGLFLLSKILLGGFHRHGGRGRWQKRRWNQQMVERWMAMSEEERAKFRAGMKGGWPCGGRRRDAEPAVGGQ
jgi:hypothetical protein